LKFGQETFFALTNQKKISRKQKLETHFPISQFFLVEGNLRSERTSKKLKKKKIEDEKKNE
jgi:hypothetical protein